MNKELFSINGRSASKKGIFNFIDREESAFVFGTNMYSEIVSDVIKHDNSTKLFVNDFLTDKKFHSMISQFGNNRIFLSYRDSSINFLDVLYELQDHNLFEAVLSSVVDSILTFSSQKNRFGYGVQKSFLMMVISYIVLYESESARTYNNLLYFLDKDSDVFQLVMNTIDDDFPVKYLFELQSSLNATNSNHLSECGKIIQVSFNDSFETIPVNKLLNNKSNIIINNFEKSPAELTFNFTMISSIIWYLSIGHFDEQFICISSITTFSPILNFTSAIFDEQTKSCYFTFLDNNMDIGCNLVEYFDKLLPSNYIISDVPSKKYIKDLGSVLNPKNIELKSCGPPKRPSSFTSSTKSNNYARDLLNISVKNREVVIKNVTSKMSEKPILCLL